MKSEPTFLWKEYQALKGGENILVPGAIYWIKRGPLDPPLIAKYESGGYFYIPGKTKPLLDITFYMEVPLPRVLEVIEKTLAKQTKDMIIMQELGEKTKNILKVAFSGLIQIMRMGPEKNLIIPFNNGTTGNISQSIAAECIVKIKEIHKGEDENLFTNVVDMHGRRVKKGGK